MKRRDFIQSGCTVCLLGAAGLITTQLAGCSPAYPVFKTDVADKKLTVPLTLFDKTPLQIVRPKALLYDIAVQKTGNDYTALKLVCTHHENSLNVTGNGYSCPLHGSQFDRAGNVRKGPAERPLQHFKTSISAANLIIEI